MPSAIYSANLNLNRQRYYRAWKPNVKYLGVWRRQFPRVDLHVIAKRGGYTALVHNVHVTWEYEYSA